MFQSLSYNIMTNNCHAFAAHALNLQNYGGRQNWEMVGSPLSTSSGFELGRFGCAASVLHVQQQLLFRVGIPSFFRRAR